MNKALRVITIILISIAVLLWGITIIGWYMTEPSFEPLNILVSAMLSTLLAGLSWLKSRKSSSSNFKPPSTTNIGNDVQAGVMITGGTNVTVKSNPSQLNYLLVNSRSSEESSEYFGRILGISTHSFRYDKEQFESYRNIWRTLQKLKLAGDNLWEEATEENMAHFYDELLRTREQVHENAPFFEERHYDSLCSVLEEFDAYGLGKEELVKLYAAIKGHRKMPKWKDEIKTRVERRIQQNQKIKKVYEDLLGEILVSFRDKLSGKQKAKPR